MASKFLSKFLATTTAAAAIGLAATLVTAPAAQAAPAPASGSHQVATASAHMSAASQQQGPEFFKRLGTKVKVVNNGDQSIWVREFSLGSMKWMSPREIQPGQSWNFEGKEDGFDDVELNVFTSLEDANNEDNGINVDAENPAYSTPWLSVDWDSEYFSEGHWHTWVADNGMRFTGHRNGDCSHYKNFTLDITNL